MISFHNIFKHHFFKKHTEPALPELFPQRAFCSTFPLCSVCLLFLPSLFSLVTTWDAHFSAFGCMLILHIYKHVAGTTLFFFYKMRSYFIGFAVSSFSHPVIYGNPFQLHGVSPIHFHLVGA